MEIAEVITAFLGASRQYLESTEVKPAGKPERHKHRQSGRLLRATPSPRKFPARHAEEPSPCCPEIEQACPRLCIPGHLATRFIRENLLDAVTHADIREIVIDLGEIAEIDGDCLQFIVAAKRTAADLGKSIHFYQSIDPVIGLLDLCDLAGLFVRPSQIRHLH